MNNEIIEKLFEWQDKDYKSFQCKLIPTVKNDSIIGVRTPILRKYAHEIAGCDKVGFFLEDLPHKYYEENNLHAFVLCEIKDYDDCIKMLDNFLPYINNWATCDSMKPKCFKKNKDKLIIKINEWLESDDVYTVRFAISMLLTHYLDCDFKPEYLELVSKTTSDEYYINMMIAWYFATALAKQWESTIPFIENNLLSEWVHRKTITKALESYRITPQQKEYLKSFKTK